MYLNMYVCGLKWFMRVCYGVLLWHQLVEVIIERINAIEIR